MRILLTGATGFLGWRTLEKLVELDWVTHVVATGRTIKPTHFVAHSKAKYVLGELSDKEFVNQIVTGIDVIVHTAGLSSPWGSEKNFVQANLTPQKYLVSAAFRTGINRFIFISTPSLYFELKDKRDIKESDPLPKKLINPYSITKFQAEMVLKNSKIPYVILRPRALIGRGDTVIMPRLIRAADEAKLKQVGNGQNYVDFTSVSNVVDAIILSLKVKERGINKTYNITNGSPVKLWDVVARLLPKVGREFPKKKVPYSIAINMARLMEFISKITTNKEPALTVYSVGILVMNFTLDITKAKKHLGYSPSVTTSEAIDEFANWYTSLNKK